MQARLRGERTAVRLRDPLADREAESEAAALGGARARPVGAPEAVEDEGEIRGRDADPRVAHGERDLTIAASERELHLTALRRVLDRVGDEVEEELSQPR